MGKPQLHILRLLIVILNFLIINANKESDLLLKMFLKKNASNVSFWYACIVIYFMCCPIYVHSFW